MNSIQSNLLTMAFENAHINLTCIEGNITNYKNLKEIRGIHNKHLSNEVKILNSEKEIQLKYKELLIKRDKEINNIIKQTRNKINEINEESKIEKNRLMNEISKWKEKINETQLQIENSEFIISDPIPIFDTTKIIDIEHLKNNYEKLKEQIIKRKELLEKLKKGQTNDKVFSFNIFDIENDNIENDKKDIKKKKKKNNV